MANTGNQWANIDDRWTKRVKGPDGKMVSVPSPLKSKVTRYRVRWVDETGKERSKSFSLKADAQRLYNKVMADIHAGESTDPTRGSELFGPVAEQWYTTKSHRKPSTLGGYRSILDLIVLPQWKDVPLKKITFEAYQVWLGEIARTGSQKGGPLSASRVTQTHQLMGAVLNHAVRTGRLTKNVAREIDRDKDLPEDAEKERVYLTHAQLLNLAAACGPYETVTLILGYTGLRFGELAPLRRRHVGDQEGLAKRQLKVHLSATRVPAKVLPPGADTIHEDDKPKNKRSRTVPVPKPVWDRLIKELPVDPDAYVFPSQRGGILPREEYRRYFDAARAGLKLPAGLTPHSLRHTCASLAVSAGANVKVLQRMLGHASAAMTLDTYADLFDDDLEKVADALGEAIESAPVLHRYKESEDRKKVS